MTPIPLCLAPWVRTSIQSRIEDATAASWHIPRALREARDSVPRAQRIASIVARALDDLAAGRLERSL